MVSTTPRGKVRRVVAVALLAVAPAGTWACGFHTDQSIAQTLLNLHYPDALHVDGAVWSAQEKGLLPLDRKRLQATGTQRRMLDTLAFRKTQRAFFALDKSFKQHSSEISRPGMAVVLTETIFWTRYPVGDEIKLHVSGPEPDDLVIVTDEPVLHVIAEGRLTIDEAINKGLIRLYGTPEQENIFVLNYGKFGAEPLPKIDEQKLMQSMLWNRPQ
jgi:hypothetical protein